jgi:hypothetical protein
MKGVVVQLRRRALESGPVSPDGQLQFDAMRLEPRSDMTTRASVSWRL